MSINVARGVEVCDRARHRQRALVGAHAQAPARQSATQQLGGLAPRPHEQTAALGLRLRVAVHAFHFGVAQRLTLARRTDALAQRFAVAALSHLTDAIGRRDADLDAQIDAIQDRPRELGAIALEISGRASTGLAVVSTTRSPPDALDKTTWTTYPAPTVAAYPGVFCRPRVL